MLCASLFTFLLIFVYFSRALIRMKTILIIVSLAAIFLAQSIDATLLAPIVDPSQGKKCSTEANCGGLKHCCVGIDQGTYCSECCDDSDCKNALLPSYVTMICVPGYNYYTKVPNHSRFCKVAKVEPKGVPCFRNEICHSGICNKAHGWYLDRIALPLGFCA